MCVEVGRVLVDEALDRLKTKTKHYNIIYIMALIALFENKERFLCHVRKFIIWVSYKDKIIYDLDIKSLSKKLQQARISFSIFWIIQKLL